jgi:hypothetical protein
MYAVVVHNIGDPEKFWGTVEDVINTDGMPGTIKVHTCYPDQSGSRAVFLQEANSVEPLREWIERTFGPASTNEYFQVEAQSVFALGLPA